MTSDTRTGVSIEDVVLFDPPPSRRSFAAGDVVRLVVGLVLIAAGLALSRAARATIEGIERDLVVVVGLLPDTLEDLLLDVARVVASSIPTVAVIVLLTRRRWKLVTLLLLTGALATVAMALSSALLVGRDVSAALEALRAEGSTRNVGYPTSQLIAASVAVVTVAAPWLSRRWRRALWDLIGVLVVVRLLAVAEPAFDLVLAVGIGTAVGAAVLLLFGSPENEPTPPELLAALRSAGFLPSVVERSRRTGGAPVGYRFSDGDGDHAVVLRTPDERDADLLARLYRRWRFQASEVNRAYATLLDRLQHEALALTLAERAGARVPAVERLGTTDNGSAFLVTTDPPARPSVPADLRAHEVLCDLWAQVLRLHTAGLAHRALTLEAFHLDDECRVHLRNFDAAHLAPTDRELGRDVAEVLTETALAVGAEEAVAAAVAVMGPERVAPALRMLQPLALPTATRRRAKAAGDVLAALRSEVNARTGEPGLALEDLERVKPRTVLVIAVSTLAFYALLPQLANVDDTIAAFGDARPAWLAGTVVASALTYVFAAASLQGAVADPVPFAANVRAQVASSFAGLVGPAGAGGLALMARFLERVGVRPAEAGASVAVNAVAGFVVHLCLLAAFVLWAGRSGLGRFSLPGGRMLLVVLAGVLPVLALLVAIEPLRRRALGPLLTSLRAGLGQIGRTFRDPGRVAALFGGSAALSITYIAAVACCVQSFGGGISFGQIGAAYLGAVAVATFAPTPGGLGALESAMIAGLTGFGLADGVAVSVTLTFRLATFWLPILPGWGALGWMQGHDEL